MQYRTNIMGVIVTGFALVMFNLILSIMDINLSEKFHDYIFKMNNANVLTSLSVIVGIFVASLSTLFLFVVTRAGSDDTKEQAVLENEIEKLRAAMDAASSMMGSTEKGIYQKKRRRD